VSVTKFLAVGTLRYSRSYRLARAGICWCYRCSCRSGNGIIIDQGWDAIGSSVLPVLTKLSGKNWTLQSRPRSACACVRLCV